MPEATFDNSTITISPHAAPRVLRILRASFIGQTMTDVLESHEMLRETLEKTVGRDAAEAVMEPLDDGIGRAWDAIDAALERAAKGRESHY